MMYSHPQRSIKDRIWVYPKGSWMTSPDWPKWRRWVPYRGEDERAYRTLVLPLPFKGNVVVAWRKCYDPECLEMAAQYAAYASERDD